MNPPFRVAQDAGPTRGGPTASVDVGHCLGGSQYRYIFTTYAYYEHLYDHVLSHFFGGGGRWLVQSIIIYIYIYIETYIYIMYMSICVEPTYWDTVWLLSIAYFGCNRITSKQNCHRNNHRDMTGNEMYNQQRGDMTGTYM